MLKRILPCFFAATAAANFCLTAFAETEYSQVDRKEPNSLLILGDSIATGYGLDGYAEGDNMSAANYGSMLKDEYGLTNETYRNYAIDGQTSSELAEKISKGIYDDYLHCEVVVVSIGGNDLLNVIFDEENGIFSDIGDIDLSDVFSGKQTLDQFFASVDVSSIKDKITEKAQENIDAFGENLSKIISGIKQADPQCQVVIQTLYDPMNTGIDPIDKLYADNIDKLNDVINSTEGAVVADVYAAFEREGGDLIQKDFTHPNAEGHKLIYQTVSKCIDEKCQFYNTVEIEKTTVEVQKPKSHLKKYIAAVCIFAAAAVITAVIGIIIRLSAKRRQEDQEK